VVHHRDVGLAARDGTEGEPCALLGTGGDAAHEVWRSKSDVLLAAAASSPAVRSVVQLVPLVGDSTPADS
jgi:hypothetical protein